MKTEIKKKGDTVIVNLDGRLDFETAIPFKEELEKLMDRPDTDTVPKKFIFNLANLEFVGSSGITSFIQTLKDFTEVAQRVQKTKPIYCNVGNEFRRILKAFDEKDIFEFFDNEDRAQKSFDQ